MKYLLDTDTFSYLVEGVPCVVKQFIRYADELAGISAITCGEVRYGIQKRDVGKARQKRIDTLLDQIPILQVDQTTATIYGQLRNSLEKIGQPIGPNDFWIAAHALSLGATLVTNNVREFKRIKGLKVDNWLT